MPSKLFILSENCTPQTWKFDSNINNDIKCNSYALKGLAIFSLIVTFAR